MVRRRLAAELKSNWQRHVEKRPFTEEEVRFSSIALHREIEDLFR